MNTLRVLILISLALSSLSFAQENNNPIFGKIVNRKTGDMLFSVCASEVKANEPCKGYFVYFSDGNQKKLVRSDAVFIRVPEDFAKEFRKAKREFGNITYPRDPVQAANDLWGKDAEFNLASNVVEEWNAPGIIRIPATAAAHVFDLMTVAVSPVGLALETAMWVPFETSLGIDGARADKAVRVLFEDGGDIRLSRLNFKLMRYLLSGGELSSDQQ